MKSTRYKLPRSIQRQREKRRKRNIEASVSRIPDGLKECTVESWEESWKGICSKTKKPITVSVGEFPKAALSWSPRTHRCLTVFSIDNGNGKTHVATAIYRKTIENLDYVSWGEWWSANELMNMIYKGFQDGTAAALESKLRSCHLFLLDDLGRQHRGSEDARARLSGIICDRFDNNKPTIITTNLTERMLRKWDPAVCDRVCDRNFSVRVGRSGPSFRRTRYP